MSAKSYLNFDLLLNQIGDGYQAHVIDSPAGQASQMFTLPFSALELENFILKIGQNRGNVRSLHLDTLDIPSVKKLGGALYNCIFSGAVAERFRSSLALARHEGQGLRIRLRLSGAPALTDIPWELMFDTANNNYVGLSVNTPIVRQLDLATQPEIRQIQGALQVLVMISSPTNYPLLDVEREWRRINNATRSLQKQGRLVLTRIKPSLAALQQQLRKGEYHVFHYIGHGGFDRSSNDGVLVLEDEQRKGYKVSGQYLGTILYDETTIQLALLNSCSGGRTSMTDPFAGVGQSLLQKGIPAVIAMQFEITDEAAITFSHEFYAALADGYPVDAAVAEARKMIYAKANQLEWATPVLYMSTDSGGLIQPTVPLQIVSPRWGWFRWCHQMPQGGFKYLLLGVGLALVVWGGGSYLMDGKDQPAPNGSEPQGYHADSSRLEPAPKREPQQPASQSIAELPAFMQGKWRGETRSQMFAYQIEITFSPTGYFITSTTVAGVCSGTLTLMAKDDTSATFQEHLTEDQCTDDKVTLTKIDDSSLNFLANDPLGLIAIEGVLHKVDQ